MTGKSRGGNGELHREEGAVTSLVAEVPPSKGDPKRNQEGQMQGKQAASDRGAHAELEGKLLVRWISAWLGGGGVGCKAHCESLVVFCFSVRCRHAPLSFE